MYDSKLYLNIKLVIWVKTYLIYFWLYFIKPPSISFAWINSRMKFTFHLIFICSIISFRFLIIAFSVTIIFYWTLSFLCLTRIFALNDIMHVTVWFCIFFKYYILQIFYGCCHVASKPCSICFSLFQFLPNLVVKVEQMWKNKRTKNYSYVILHLHCHNYAWLNNEFRVFGILANFLLSVIKVLINLIYCCTKFFSRFSRIQKRVMLYMH